MTATDFTVSGTNAPVAVTAVTRSDTAYDVQVTGGDLAGLDARVALSFAAGHDIVDTADHDMVNTRPTGTKQSRYLVDNARPVLSTATAKGTKLTLTCDEVLDEASEPAASTFAVTVGGAPRTVEAVEVEGSTVTLTLASPATADDTVMVAYTAPAAPDPALRDAPGPGTRRAGAPRGRSPARPATHPFGRDAGSQPRRRSEPRARSPTRWRSRQGFATARSTRAPDTWTRLTPPAPCPAYGRAVGEERSLEKESRRGGSGNVRG